jgi:hypothetical protein
MRVGRLGLILLCTAAVTACTTSYSSGSHGTVITPGVASPPAPSTPLVCPPGQTVEILGGVPRCVG